ncbi:MAG: spore coat protein GerQ [Bacilli bacterium]
MYPEPAYIPGESTSPPNTNIPSYNQNYNNEQYALNILEKNIGKTATFYMSYSDSLEWRDKIFVGIIESAGKDYALIHDPITGKRNLLWTVYLNYVTFDEGIKIN